MIRSIATLSLALIAAPAFAEGGRVTTLVVVKTPPGVTRAQLEAGFAQLVPAYQKIPGLIRKYYTITDSGFGGMYLWDSRTAAQAWYSPAWAAQCKARYSSDCQVSYFDTPLQIDGMAATK